MGEQEGVPPLWMAAFEGDVDEVNELLKKGADVNVHAKVTSQHAMVTSQHVIDKPQSRCRATRSKGGRERQNEK